MSYGNSRDSSLAGCGSAALLGIIAVVLVAAGLLFLVGGR